MHPATICSYYPNYAILDEVISQSNYKNLNIYIDLKNVLQTLYLKHAVSYMIESSKNTKFPDTSIFLSLLMYFSFHKKYVLKRNINLKIYVFFESGKSYYHLNIDKNYKKSRIISDLFDFGIDSTKLFFNVLSKNYSLIEQAFNKIPNIKVIRMLNLEADFIPYYLIRNKLVDTSDDTAHVIYSTDHDLFQCIKKNVFVFLKYGTKKKLLKQGEVLKQYLKIDKGISDIYLPLAMSIIGDPGDDIIGIKGIGGKKFLDILDNLKKLIGSVGNLYNNVFSSRPIFDLSNVKLPNKYLRMVIEHEEESGLISKNLKLISFELISRALDNPLNTEIIKKRKRIYNVIKEDKIVNKENMYNALQNVGVMLSDELDALYYKV